MMHFLMNCVHPDAVMMLVLALICLIGFGYPGYRGSVGLWILWLFAGILALVAGVILVGN